MRTGVTYAVSYQSKLPACSKDRRETSAFDEKVSERPGGGAPACFHSFHSTPCWTFVQQVKKDFQLCFLPLCLYVDRPAAWLVAHKSHQSQSACMLVRKVAETYPLDTTIRADTQEALLCGSRLACLHVRLVVAVRLPITANAQVSRGQWITVSFSFKG